MNLLRKEKFTAGSVQWAGSHALTGFQETEAEEPT
jgi:hypothetical protein